MPKDKQPKKGKSKAKSKPRAGVGRKRGARAKARADQEAARRLDLRRAIHPGEPLGDADLPIAAIVILNYNGLHLLQDCFESLRALNYPSDRLRVILVDNGSSDGSVEAMGKRWSWVQLETFPHNTGFCVACNHGAKVAVDAEVLVFMNNDMRVEPDWLRELVAPVVRGECAAATAKMMSWDGKLTNSTGGGMNFHGIGIQKGYLVEPTPEHDVPARTLFACGGAVAFDAAVFRDVGGFDEAFFAYYEDVDLGWRLWVMGHEVHYAPRAVCYHHHSSTSRRFPPETVRLLQTRNPVLTCFKNYDDEHLRQIMPAMFALFMRRMMLNAGIEDDSSYRIESAEPRAAGVVGRLFDRARHSTLDRQPIKRLAVADLVGINDFLGNWDHWLKRRRAIQARRARADAEIFSLFHQPMWCIEADLGYGQLHEGLVDFMGLNDLFDGLHAKGPDPHA